MDRSRAHAVRWWGAGEPLVVFGHGVGGSQAHWNAVVHRLESKARIMTYALAGSPGADPALFSPARHASLLGFTDDLALLLAELGIRGPSSSATPFPP